MTHLFANGEPVEVTLGADGRPAAFTWRGVRREVDFVANQWRVQTTWWSEDASREYYKLATVDRVLVTIFRDLNTGAWLLARVYD